MIKAKAPNLEEVEMPNRDSLLCPGRDEEKYCPWRWRCHRYTRRPKGEPLYLDEFPGSVGPDNDPGWRCEAYIPNVRTVP